MTFRVLKFKPNAAAAAAATATASAAPAQPRRLRPPLGHDNKWWWDGIAAGELRIQRCKECKTLRHPPRPMCGNCQSIEWDWVDLEGRRHGLLVRRDALPADSRLRLPAAGRADRPRRRHAPRRQRRRLQAVGGARRHARAGEDRSRGRRDEPPLLLPGASSARWTSIPATNRTRSAISRAASSSRSCRAIG